MSIKKIKLRGSKNLKSANGRDVFPAEMKGDARRVGSRGFQPEGPGGEGVMAWTRGVRRRGWNGGREESVCVCVCVYARTSETKGLSVRE